MLSNKHQFLWKVGGLSLKKKINTVICNSDIYSSVKKEVRNSQFRCLQAHDGCFLSFLDLHYSSANKHSATQEISVNQQSPSLSLCIKPTDTFLDPRADDWSRLMRSHSAHLQTRKKQNSIHSALPSYVHKET